MRHWIITWINEGRDYWRAVDSEEYALGYYDGLLQKKGVHTVTVSCVLRSTDYETHSQLECECDGGS